MAQELLIYWLLAQLFGLVGLPLAQVWLGALPDRGYAFAKPLGLLLTGYLAWLVAMLGLAAFGAQLLLVCAAAVLAAGLLAQRAWGGSDDRSLGFSALSAGSLRRAAPVAWLRGEWRVALGYELLFAAALVFLAAMRSHDLGFVGPNPWGTERPMDYALFNAIRQSHQFPPHDPWLAGYAINYYYFGYLLMAAVATLSGLSPAVSYNLSLALVFALAALGVAGVAYNLIGLTVLDQGPRTKDQGRAANADDDAIQHTMAAAGRRSLGIGRPAAMVLAVVLVLFAANQGGALQVITGSDMAVALPPGDLARAVVNGLGPRAPLQLSQPFRGEYFDGTAEIVPTDQADTFNWWNSSRAVWDTFMVPDDQTGTIVPFRRYAITEFPFFSFWLGDMHPHVMALPFGLLAIALALSVVARREPPGFAQGRRGWLEVALAGVALGSLYVINSWDLPTYVLLFAGALALRFVGPRSFPWRAYAMQLAPVLVAAFALFLPFHLTFRSLVGGREPLLDLPLIGGLTRTIGFVTWGRTELHQFIVIFGLFLVPLLGFLAAQWRGPGSGGLPRWWPWATLAALIAGAIVGFPLLALLPLGVAAAALAFERADEPAQAFALGAFALGCAICFGTELIYIRDVFESRLNTIFKFYYQVWVLWGVAAAYALWWLVTQNREPRTKNRLATGSWFLVLGSFLVLLAGALVYPRLTIGQAFGEGTQVGLAGVTPRERTPEGAASIAWLRQNAAGDAVVLEAVGPAYDTASLGFGGVSSSTGLATVIGWEGHQQQWRGGQPEVLALVGPRAADVATIYSTTDVEQARGLLRQYGVDYIYVGGAERATYPPEGLDKLPQLGQPVFQQGEVAIYRVNP